MKTKNPLFVVNDMEKAKTFYREVLGLRVTAVGRERPHLGADCEAHVRSSSRSKALGQ